ncbi:hypothetical protein Y032_0014g2376 [Ancylostoma ceylanicum]|uniref:Uncharacterized protein n=1 Tax=Ancylostoma ceylanicum TaxID=53326 RepID=A0A016VBU3_9BILA|nr:hypothetical protein Y032_0014g2376 [Ancylostoma ceylanicum]
MRVAVTRNKLNPIIRKLDGRENHRNWWWRWWRWWWWWCSSVRDRRRFVLLLRCAVLRGGKVDNGGEDREAEHGIVWSSEILSNDSRIGKFTLDTYVWRECFYMMKDGSKRIAYAAQTHAFTVSEQPRVLLVENVHAILTSLHGKSTASGCVRLPSINRS